MERSGHVGCWFLVGSVIGYLAGLDLLDLGLVVSLGVPFAILPDQDLKFGGHRGATHSLLFAVVVSAVVGLATWLVWSSLPPSVVRFLIVRGGIGSGLWVSLLFSTSALGGLLSHCLADVITPAGVPLLWPRRKKYSLGVCRSDSSVANGVFSFSGVLVFLLVFWSSAPPGTVV